MSDFLKRFAHAVRQQNKICRLVYETCLLFILIRYSPKVALEIQFLLSCQMKKLAAQCSYGFAAFSDLSWRIALC